MNGIVLFALGRPRISGTSPPRLGRAAGLFPLSTFVGRDEDLPSDAPGLSLRLWRTIVMIVSFRGADPAAVRVFETPPVWRKRSD